MKYSKRERDKQRNGDRKRGGREKNKNRYREEMKDRERKGAKALSITTLSIKGLHVTLSISDTQHKHHLV